MNLQPFLTFILERENIRLRREAGQPWPWTEDPILRQYRFCNVRREDDTVSQWIFKNITVKEQGSPHLWFAFMVARHLNLPESLAEVLPILPFKAERVRQALLKRKAEGLKNFNGAYMITTNGVRGDKVDLIIDRVLKPAWKRRGEFGEVGNLQSLFEWLITLNGLQSFLAGQIIADLKWAPQYRNLPDWYSFIAIGPGSRRGLNRIFGRDTRAVIKDEEFKACTAEISEFVNAELGKLKWRSICSQGIQNCECEWDKYERVRLGEGRPKQIYRPLETVTDARQEKLC